MRSLTVLWLFIALFTIYKSCLALIPATLSDSDKLQQRLASLHLPDLATVSIAELQEQLQDGAFTSVDLVHTYNARITDLNALIHAVSDTNSNAILEAGALDYERAHGHFRGPLHGIPILLKDNIATLPPLSTTTGSFALQGSIAGRESPIVTKLRDAGAIILGKATMGEWAQFRSWGNMSSHGWSAMHGQPLGVFHADQDPHGSSSGCGVAVAAGLAAGCIGTETSGSIVNPAEKGNLVGIKPTLGLTTRDMVIPISRRQDTVGPMARTVRDAAMVLGVIAGRDERDNWTMAQPETLPDFTKACNSATLRGARIGVPRNGIIPFLDHNTAPTMAAFEKALRIMANAGAKIADFADFPYFNITEFSHNQAVVLDTDFALDVQKYLSTLSRNPYDIQTLADILNFTSYDPREEYLTRGTHVWHSALNRDFDSFSSESFAAYQRNLELATTLGVEGVLDLYGLDAIVMPTFTSFHLPAVGGLPIVTVPLGFFPEGTVVRKNPIGTMVQIGPGIPFGIAFVGRKWSEEILIRLAAAFEDLTKAREEGKPVVRSEIGLEARLNLALRGHTREVVVARVVGYADRGHQVDETLVAGNQSSCSMLGPAGSMFGATALKAVK